ncbi:MAG: [FeFe] hydrogenase H-cluster maturation GTPase HydF, partial [Armatimonadetes bacterium]|nr:[FeFe] hydrogenase H-cluster maturation GTPase HydF [Armatimonadota bacterium]
ILPLGPVVIIDTAGIDDTGELGEARVGRTLRVLEQTDLALLVLDATVGVNGYEQDLARRIQGQGTSLVAVVNKIDLHPDDGELVAWARAHELPVASVSAVTGEGIGLLKQRMIEHAPSGWAQPTILGDLINPGDTVVMCIPIDKAAPKGRLILPQVMAIRDVLDRDGIAVMAKERELKYALANLGRKPKLVVTDSQVLLKAAADTPQDVLFTSFSILFARYKGDLEEMAQGAKAIEALRPGDKVLIAEACTHHRQPDDIGKVQIPRWLRQLVGGDLTLHWTAGGDFPEDLATYKLVVHCGGCMLNRQEMLSRIDKARQEGVAIVNYGVFLAAVHGVLERALGPFPAALMAWEEANE